MGRRELEELGFTNIVEDEDAPSIVIVGPVVEQMKKNVSAETLRRSEEIFARVRARVAAKNSSPEGSPADGEPPSRH